MRGSSLGFQLGVRSPKPFRGSEIDLLQHLDRGSGYVLQLEDQQPWET